MKKLNIILATAMVAGVASATLISHDANIVTDNLGSMLQDEGLFVQAENYGGGAVTVGGIDFAAGTSTLGWTSTTSFGGTDANINLLVNTQRTKNWAVKTASTITGLTVGQEYRVQILAGEPWEWSDILVNLAGTATSETAENLTDGVLGLDLVVYEFVALGDTLEIQYGSVGTDNGAIAGYAVHAIPEPATLGLVATFGGAMLFVRRKFRR